MDIFNEMTVSEYIHKMYRYSNNLSGDAPGQAFTLCCAHFMKMAARDIRTTANDEEERIFNITVVGNILNVITFSEADSCIRALVTVLLTKRQNLFLMRSFNLLRKFTPEQVQQTDPIEDFRDEQGSFVYVFYERSPFYKEYSEVAMEVINAGSDERNVPNKYYNEGWCWTFLRKYDSVLPLCSAFGNPLRKRFSNAVAENNFRHIKHDILGYTFEGCLSIN